MSLTPRLLATSFALLFTFESLVDPGTQAFAQSGYLPRNNYGRKFEPTDGILHGAGQGYFRDRQSSICQITDCLSEAAERYTEELGTSLSPLLFMDYNNSTSENVPSWYNGLSNRIEVFETNYNRQLVPQLGTFLTPGTVLLTQNQINNIVNGLASLNRPVFYRPGYEANGPWFGLDPETYKTNFRNISNAVRAANLPVAMVWNVVVGDGGTHSLWDSPAQSVEDFYPGDEYVDWWSFNVFGSITFDSFWDNEVSEFLAAADAAGFPVLIGEATPQFIGAESASDWNDWFAPFFDRIKNNPGIKAHTYINWDWAQTNPAENWTNWGDASLENAHPTVRNNYVNEISDPIYVHSGSVLPEFFFETFDPADFNEDGSVDNLDLVIWQNAYGANSQGDANEDGVTNGLDFLIWQRNRGLATATTTTIPEPSSLVLGLLALVSCTRFTRRIH